MDIFKKKDRYRRKEGVEIPRGILKESKDFLHRMLNIFPNSIYLYDLGNKNIIYANNYSSTCFGYTPQQVVQFGDNFFIKKVHPEDLPKLLQYYKDIIDLKDGEIKSIEVRFSHANGSWVWVNLRESVLKRNKKGEVQQLIGNAVDITDKKMRDAEIEEKLHFINSIINTTPGNVFVFDTTVNKVLFDSMNVVRTLGYTPDDLIAMGEQFFPQLLNPEDVWIAQATIDKMKDSDADQNFSYAARFRRADGSWCWLNVNLRPSKRNGQGVVTEAVGVAIDITAQKEAEILLKENKEFIEKLLLATPGNIFLFDTIEYKVLFDSMNALQTLGYSQDDVKEHGNQFFPQLEHPDDVEITKSKNEIVKKSKTDENVSHVARFRHADGSWHWFNITLRPFKRDDEGIVREAVGVAIDISPQKEAEIRLKESQNFIEKVLSTIPGDIFVNDPIENKILFSTNTTITIGYTPEEVIKMGAEFLPKLVHPDDLPGLTMANKIIAETKEDKIFTGEARFRHANGQWRWFEINFRPFKRNEEQKVIQAVGVVIDITQRKEAEMRLKESEVFVKKITDAVPHFIIVHDLIENKNVFSNHELQIATGFGVPLNEIKNYNIYSLVHPDDLQAFLENEKKILSAADNEVLESEARFRGVDGIYRWENMRTKVFKRNDKGEVSQIVISAIDITARKEAEEELRESKLFIERITETAPNIIYVFDLVNMKNIYINKNSIEILGYSPEEIKWMGEGLIPYLMHPEDLPKVIAHFEEMRKSFIDIVSTIEYRMKDSKGQWHWFVGKDAVFQRDEEGRVSKIAGVSTDITYIKKIEDELKDLNSTLEKKVQERTQELQKSEENLRQSENQLKLITNAIPALISYVDNKESYRFANPYYRNLLNVSDDITGKKIKDVIGFEAYSKGKENVQMALRGETISFENKMTMKDGSVKTLNVSFIPDKDEKKRTRGIVIMGVDLTDRIEYEKNLESKNTELKRINADLDNFIYTASHDLKTPIANLEGLLIGILGDIQGKISEEIRLMFDMMDVSIQRLKTTINELTEISKVQRSYGENKELLDINQLIEEFKTEFSFQITNSRAVIVPQLNVPHIWFSRKNFRSIIYNLLDNAIKYRSPERRPLIVVKTEMLKNECMLMTVKDNGLGFDMRQKDKIFGMFKRMHTHIEGTGIGLYIVKKIVENSGGTIHVKSEVNKGSVFKVYFITKNTINMPFK